MYKEKPRIYKEKANNSRHAFFNRQRIIKPKKLRQKQNSPGKKKTGRTKGTDYKARKRPIKTWRQ